MPALTKKERFREKKNEKKVRKGIREKAINQNKSPLSLQILLSFRPPIPPPPLPSLLDSLLTERSELKNIASRVSGGGVIGLKILWINV
jgi:hypothetical protein